MYTPATGATPDAIGRFRQLKVHFANINNAALMTRQLQSPEKTIN
ncbi:hypothetical protein [Salmonella enterica]